MARIRIVELLDARGHVRSRTRLESCPAMIGRAFDSDVIVDDPFVSPHHLRLTEDEAGTLWVEDAGSTNGTRLAHQAMPEVRFAVPSGGAVVIGKSTLRIFDADHAVPVATPMHREERSLADLFSQPRNIGLAAAATALLFATQGYLNSTSREVGERMISLSLGALMLTALWAGLWALIGRMTHAGTRYWAHLGWACAGAFALTLVSLVLGWIEFAIPSNDGVAALVGVVLTASFAVYLAGHVTLASSLAPRRALRRTIVGLGGVAAVIALVLLTSRDDFSATPDFPTTLASIPTALLQTEGIDAFAAQTLQLQKEVDELASKRERESLLPSALKAR